MVMSTGLSGRGVPPSTYSSSWLRVTAVKPPSFSAVICSRNRWAETTVSMVLSWSKWWYISTASRHSVRSVRHMANPSAASSTTSARASTVFQRIASTSPCSLYIFGRAMAPKCFLALSGYHSSLQMSTI